MRNIALVGSILLFITCSVQGSSSDSIPISIDTVVVRISENQPSYSTLSQRAKLYWGDAAGEEEFQASIRIRHDSLIWISLTGAFGIEGGRALITNDSFRLINKLNSEYIARDFSYIEDWIMFPIKFKMLQSILAGNKIDVPESATLVTMEDSSLVIFTESNQLIQKIWVSSTGYTISKMLLKDKLLKQEMAVTFDDYNLLEGKPFSYNRKIDVTRDDSVISLRIVITKARINEDQTYPFEVNEKYKRKD